VIFLTQNRADGAVLIFVANGQWLFHAGLKASITFKIGVMGLQAPSRFSFKLLAGKKIATEKVTGNVRCLANTPDGIHKWSLMPSKKQRLCG